MTRKDETRPLGPGSCAAITAAEIMASSEETEVVVQCEMPMCESNPTATGDQA